MRTSILTDLERDRAKAYVKQGGQRAVKIRTLALRAQQYLPRIREDIKLLERVLDTYEDKKVDLTKLGSWKIGEP